MSKPTLIQSVFKRPSRKYASQSSTSPWADQNRDADPSYSQSDIGPSKARRSRSNMSLAHNASSYESYARDAHNNYDRTHGYRGNSGTGSVLSDQGPTSRVITEEQLRELGLPPPPPTVSHMQYNDMSTYSQAGPSHVPSVDAYRDTYRDDYWDEYEHRRGHRGEYWDGHNSRYHQDGYVSQPRLPSMIDERDEYQYDEHSSPPPRDATFEREQPRRPIMQRMDQLDHGHDRIQLPQPPLPSSQAFGRPPRPIEPTPPSSDLSSSTLVSSSEPSPVIVSPTQIVAPLNISSEGAVDQSKPTFPTRAPVGSESAEAPPQTSLVTGKPTQKTSSHALLPTLEDIQISHKPAGLRRPDVANVLPSSTKMPVLEAIPISDLPGAAESWPDQYDSDSESDMDVFYTPRSSLYLDADDGEDASEDDADTPLAQTNGLPFFAVQPPTPASIVDVEPQLTLEESLDHLSPDDAERRDLRQEERTDTRSPTEPDALLSQLERAFPVDTGNSVTSNKRASRLQWQEPIEQIMPAEPSWDESDDEEDEGEDGAEAGDDHETLSVGDDDGNRGDIVESASKPVQQLSSEPPATQPTNRAAQPNPQSELERSYFEREPQFHQHETHDVWPAVKSSLAPIPESSPEQLPRRRTRSQPESPKIKVKNKPRPVHPLSPEAPPLPPKANRGGRVRGAVVEILSTTNGPPDKQSSLSRSASRSSVRQPQERTANRPRANSGSQDYVPSHSPLQETVGLPSGLVRSTSVKSDASRMRRSPSTKSVKSKPTAVSKAPPSISELETAPKFEAGSHRAPSRLSRSGTVTPSTQATSSRPQSRLSQWSDTQGRDYSDTKPLPAPPLGTEERNPHPSERPNRNTGGSQSGSDLSLAASSRSQGMPSRSIDHGVRAAGLGKGGWAAASASPVIMYMPSDSRDGWAAFQPLPPKSRYAPLPASQSTGPGPGLPMRDRLASAASSSHSPSPNASQDGWRSVSSSTRGSYDYRPGNPTIPGPQQYAGEHPRHDYHRSRGSYEYADASSPHDNYPPGIGRSMSPRPGEIMVPGPHSRPQTPARADTDSEDDDEKPSRSYASRGAPASQPTSPTVADGRVRYPGSYDGGSQDYVASPTRQGFEPPRFSPVTSVEYAPTPTRSLDYDYASEQAPSSDPSRQSSPARATFAPAGRGLDYSIAGSNGYRSVYSDHGYSGYDERAQHMSNGLPVRGQGSMVPRNVFPAPPGSAYSSSSRYSDSSQVGPRSGVMRLPVVPPEVPLDPVLEATLRPMSPPTVDPRYSGARFSAPSSAPYVSGTPSAPRFNTYEAALSANNPSKRRVDRPSSLHPDSLTFLPEMSEEASNRLYEFAVPELNRKSSERGGGHRSLSDVGASQRRSRSSWSLRAKSEAGGNGRRRLDKDLYDDRARSEAAGGFGRAHSDVGVSDADPNEQYRRQSLQDPLRRSATGRIQLSEKGGSVAGDVVLMGHVRGDENYSNGYTNLTLPNGSAYKPSTDPAKTAMAFSPRLAGLPHSAMAAITLASAPRRGESATPAHLRGTLPSAVDFTSHIKPPSKVGNAQVMLQVYAVAVDSIDILALDDKSRADIGKYIPGRSFVGRCLVSGADEKDIQRGDIVVGLVDIHRSGALCEYIVVDRRRVARAPACPLSLEQLSVLPVHGIAATRALRGFLTRGARALVMDAHDGIPALLTQEMARAGVSVTAIIDGGDDHGEHQAACLRHGARGVLTGSPAALMLRLEEGSFEVVVDTRGGVKIANAARKVLVERGKILSLASPESYVNDSQAAIGKAEPTETRTGLKSLKSALHRSNSRKRLAGNIEVSHITPAGAGEPEVDIHGMDWRDVLEDPVVRTLVPVVDRVVPLERGAEAFGGGVDKLGVTVVRIVN